MQGCLGVGDELGGRGLVRGVLGEGGWKRGRGRRAKGCLRSISRSICPTLRRRDLGVRLVVILSSLEGRLAREKGRVSKDGDLPAVIKRKGTSWNIVQSICGLCLGFLFGFSRPMMLAGMRIMSTMRLITRIVQGKPILKTRFLATVG